MRKLVVVEFITLDGVMQSLGSPDEDREGGFEHGGWAGPYGDQVQMASALEGLKSTTAYLFGRRTYEHMNAFWPHQPEANPMAAHLNAEVHRQPNAEAAHLVERPPPAGRPGARGQGAEVERWRQHRCAR